MAVLGIDHVQLAMPAGREDEARGFYAGLLGLEVMAKPQTLEGRGGCWFGRGAVVVHLGVESDFRPARKAHPAFLVDDLVATLQIMARAGVRHRADVPLDGYDRAFVDDPFGNRLELMQRRGGVS